MADHVVATIAELEAIYSGPVSPAARTKEVDRLTSGYRAWIAVSPLCLLATSGPDGLDCSPRGDGPGFVRILDDRTLLIPDRRGNNRIDSLRNIVHDPRVGLLFLVPNAGETLRVNGRAVISTEPALLAGCAIEGKQPATVLIVSVETVFIQCARALLRSALWKPGSWPERASLPTLGSILQEISSDFDGASYDRDLPARAASTLY